MGFFLDFAALMSFCITAHSLLIQRMLEPFEVHEWETHVAHFLSTCFSHKVII